MHFLAETRKERASDVYMVRGEDDDGVGWGLESGWLCVCVMMRPGIRHGSPALTKVEMDSLVAEHVRDVIPERKRRAG